MDIQQFKKEISGNSDIIILDVREPEEFVGIMKLLPNAINIPLQEIEIRFKELEVYKKNVIAVICRSGVRSRAATAFLCSNGFNAENVDGGMLSFNEN